MYRVALWAILAGYVVLALAVLTGVGFAAHGHFTDQYRSSLGSLCCGERDCKPASIRILVFGEETVTAEVNGVVVEVPARSVHQSEDENTYWCANYQNLPPSASNVRCLFWAIGT